jgi:hypothetical protein
MPKKVPLLIFGFIAFATVCILFLISLIQPDMIWNLGEGLWEWTEGGAIPNLLNWVLLILFIILLLLGLPLILVNRSAACILLAIAGILAGILLYVAMYVLPLFF